MTAYTKNEWTLLLCTALVYARRVSVVCGTRLMPLASELLLLSPRIADATSYRNLLLRPTARIFKPLGTTHALLLKRSRTTLHDR